MPRRHNTPANTPGWAEYLTWRRALWGVVLLGPFVAVGAFVAISGSGRMHVPLLAWVVVVALVGLRLQRFRCPRCHRNFFPKRPLLLGLMARRCVSCMLPKE